jgi:hypothetical protein
VTDRDGDNERDSDGDAVTVTTTVTEWKRRDGKKKQKKKKDGKGRGQCCSLSPGRVAIQSVSLTQSELRYRKTDNSPTLKTREGRRGGGVESREGEGRDC